MPRGPLPKAEGKASTRHRPTHEQVELGTAPAHVDAPKIPARAWAKLHKETRAWWNDWLAAPQASQFVVTDWRRLRMVVLPIVDAFNVAVAAKDFKLARELAGEIRLQESAFGATPESRIRNRWVVRKPGQTSGDDEKPEEPETARRRPRKVERDPRLELVKGG